MWAMFQGKIQQKPQSRPRTGFLNLGSPYLWTKSLGLGVWPLHPGFPVPFAAQLQGQKAQLAPGTALLTDLELTQAGGEVVPPIASSWCGL